LENALLVLTKDYKTAVTFWGKVLGVQEDYLICQIHDGTYGRRYVFSMDSGRTWNLLDEPTQALERRCRPIRGCFTGNPQFQYQYTVQADDTQVENGDDPVTTAVDAGKKVAVTEAQRLAIFIDQVVQHCRVIPRNFEMGGLTAVLAARLDSYLHDLPLPEGAKSIASDIPTGAWVLKTDKITQLAVGLNLLFEGYIFYHKPNSNTFGQFYIGNGERNEDLCFMLPFA
jgi:radial spoke head protein 9